MSRLQDALTRADANLDAALERLFALLRFPSISTDPAHAGDVNAAASWLVDELASLGFAAELRPTAGHPMVVAHWRGAPGGRRVLFYGHYDVQPVDPLSEWRSDPFEPRIETRDDGSKLIRARGASDDKGQLMTFLEACRAWIETAGAPPVDVSIMLEGEEESGSPSLTPFMEANRDELKADLALICDTGMWDARTPAITTMLRGLMGEEIILHGPSRDLHSGMYGGPAINPIRVLARILADLHDENGRVTLPGFYDGVPEVPPEIAAQWARLDFSAERFLGEVGLRAPAGEKDQPVLNQLWARPTCEFNGILGGYVGEGFKTVIPARASAKVSCRLVGDQDPHAIREALRAHVRARLPEDCTVEFVEHGASRASVMNAALPAFEAARQALSDEWENEAAFIGGGGSIPVAGHFQRILGMESMLIGFALDDDAIHSPNEKYELRSFHKGIRSWVRILERLA
ncbi:dipeptidase [Oceanicella actignis]|uniref:Acetylornithine deacetylase/Succinyl-diaminopimelate desuccinylase n=1 Tax=Oceanicella actignis TaxID=1189325 RepID=A0A1M7S0G9_9RHOB|nr:dipeptidase [Oceanicella actignis]TYO90088.1 acetylornithine deacetylase/succinyl-diaminopimelate desuccinylase-like protein [Oceanicella actignis]SES93746.1 Acetylornithine deacetylase/Succinyl-diaminopimelate desuccinylase [Oceanicella actignis]SHN51948.1 Acetylornithine deacetylase/Succinyl-diaminopimelate desuccinylase [Oceanicella actignis]